MVCIAGIMVFTKFLWCHLTSWTPMSGTTLLILHQEAGTSIGSWEVSAIMLRWIKLLPLIFGCTACAVVITHVLPLAWFLVYTAHLFLSLHWRSPPVLQQNLHLSIEVAICFVESINEESCCIEQKWGLETALGMYKRITVCITLVQAEEAFVSD